MDTNFMLTQESLNKLEEELEDLLSIRLEIANNLKIAADYGDLKENSEFDAERERQALIENRIKDIKNKINNCKIVNPNEFDNNKVSIGKNVVLYEYEFDEKVEYKVVDAIESDPLNGKISYLSPVGKAIINKSCGDIIEIELPFGKIKYKILEIKRA